MSIFLQNIINPLNAGMTAWKTTLDASDTLPQEQPGAVRWTYDPVLGYRAFQYVRFDQSGGALKDNPVAYRPLISVSATGAGSATTVAGSGFAVGDPAGRGVLAGGIIRCLDDAGAAGAAPEGELGYIAKNTATLITLDPNHAFSAATAASDTFRVELPWAVVDSAAGNTAALCAGVAMANQDQYDWGWVQFLGLHPGVTCVAAGTAITADRSLITGTNLLTNGSTSAPELRVGYTLHGVTTDTVLRKVPVYLHCGFAAKLAASA